MYRKKKKIMVYILALFLSIPFTTTVYARLDTQDIEKLRSELLDRGATFKVGPNSATNRDLKDLCGLVPPKDWMSKAQAGVKVTKPKVKFEANWNWCNQGMCTPVRNQGSCGSCWAFGTVGILESNLLIHESASEDLSEQYLVSCNTDGWGCDGGWWAHDYHQWKFSAPETEAGAVPESEFPYTATDYPCGGPYSHPWKINSWGYVDPYQEIPSVDDIKQAIMDYGPVGVGICVGAAFQAYNGGIFDYNEPGDVNHAVILVGWIDADGVWILRNSWGPGWGEDGYMRIKYGASQVGYAANYIMYEEQPPDPYEDDNTPATAQSVSCPVTQDHTIHENGDVDWFVVSMEVGTSIEVMTSNLGGSNPDTVLQVYDVNCNLITENDDYEGLSSMVNWTAPFTGEYYVKAMSYGGGWNGCDDQGGGPAFCSYTIGFNDNQNEEPDISVFPQDIYVELCPGESKTETLTISNVGGEILEVTEICDEEMLFQPLSSKGLDRSVLKGSKSHSLIEKIKALGLKPDLEANGDIITQCQSPATATMGVEYMGEGTLDIVSEGDGGTIWSMEEDCLQLPPYPPLPGVSPELNGITFDGQYLWITDYHGTDAESDWLYQVDPEMGVINAWDLRPQGVFGIAGVAWDGQNLWVSALDMGTIFQVDKNGNVLGSFQVDWFNAGLDWDGQYLISVDLAGFLYRVTTDGSVVDSMPAPGGGNAFGVTCAGTPGQLWVTNFMTETIDLVECNWCGDNPEPLCQNDAPWLSQSPNSGSIPAGGEMAIDVNINTDSLSLGSYDAVIRIASNDPDEDVVSIPVHLEVNDYQPCEEDDTGILDIVGKSGGPGSTVIVPVRIQGALNEIDSFGFEVAYNTGILSYTGSYSRGACMTDFDFFDVNEPENGLLVVGGFEANPEDMIQEGADCVVVYLEFSVLECEPGEIYPLAELQNLVDDMEGWPVSGACFTCGGCDVNGDGEVTPVDALCAFQKYLGICPTNCGPCEEIFCDVNGDGDCTPADALEIFKEYLGIYPNVCSTE